jgi:FAD/FMN-containing dehydrogenase
MNKSVVQDLVNIVGDARVSTEDPILASYSRCSIGNFFRYKPECVVKPTSVDEIQRVLHIANKEKIPVYPYVSAQADMWLPTLGGILIDLSGMNKVIEINEEQRYALIEPGVTQGQLWKELKKHHLVYPFCSAPPISSVLTNALHDGVGHYTCGGEGLASDHIICVEAVLPTGELLRTGSAAQPGNNWWSQYLTPIELGGLFIGAQGILGIVTKMSLRVETEPEVMKYSPIGCDNVSDAVAVMKRLCKRKIGSGMECHGVGENFPKLFSGSEAVKALPAKPSNHVIPLFLEGDKKIVEYHEEEITKILSNLRAEGYSVRFEESIFAQPLVKAQKDSSSAAPWRLPPSPYGVLQFDTIHGMRLMPCFYLPLDDWNEFLPWVFKTLQENGQEPTYTGAPIEWGRFTFTRFWVNYSELEPESWDKGVKLTNYINNYAMQKGYILRRSMQNSKVLLKNAGPTYYLILKKLKEIFDPNNIMAPGHLLDLGTS